MPVEIKELDIKAVINPSRDTGAKAALSASELERLKKEIIRECMDKIMSRLQEKTER